MITLQRWVDNWAVTGSDCVLPKICPYLKVQILAGIANTFVNLHLRTKFPSLTNGGYHRFQSVSILQARMCNWWEDLELGTVLPALEEYSLEHTY